MAFVYRHFDKCIWSEIELSALATFSTLATPDILIRLDVLPYQDEGSASVYIPDGDGIVAHCHPLRARILNQGKELLLAWNRAAAPHEIRDVLIDQVIPLVLFMQGALILHASAVCASINGVCFAGPSGMGKSTIAASFVERGYSLIDDDRCLLRRDGNQTTITGHCGYLKAEQATLSLVDFSRWTKQGINAEGKHRLFPPVDRYRSSANLRQLILLVRGPKQTICEASLAQHFGLLLASIQLSDVLVTLFGHDFMTLMESVFSQVPLLLWTRPAQPGGFPPTREIEIELEGVTITANA